MARVQFVFKVGTDSGLVTVRILCRWHQSHDTKQLDLDFEDFLSHFSSERFMTLTTL